MAKHNNNFLNLILVLSFLLIISFTEGRLFDCEFYDYIFSYNQYSDFNLLLSSSFYFFIYFFSYILTTYICGAVGFGEGKSTGPECISVYGAQQGDTCSGIIQKFSLNADFFTAINPNLNCNTFFVGQWLCIDGTMS